MILACSFAIYQILYQSTALYLKVTCFSILKLYNLFIFFGEKIPKVHASCKAGTLGILAVFIFRYCLV